MRLGRQPGLGAVVSTFKVTVEKLKIYPHPNADLLELAGVGGYRAVVGKGQFQDGDYAIYIPEQAVLPPELVEELGLSGKLAGKDKNRVKAVRLRGEMSQGIVCRPRSLTVNWDGIRFEIEEGITHEWHGQPDSHDFAPKLGITKWVPPIPVGMAGQVESAPDLIRWIEIENIKRYPNIFTEGEQVVATEKVHGTCCLLTYTRSSDQVFVTSKGQGSKNLAILPSDTNVYWRAVRRYKLADVARALADALEVDKVGLFGEVYGRGVQDLHYGGEADRNDTLGYALFDIAVHTEGEVRFLDAAVYDLAVTSLLPEELRDVPMVPVLYRGPYDYELLKKLAEGREEVSGLSLHIREGLVVRPETERKISEIGGRAIAKFVSEAYLTRGGAATEYE